MAKDRETGKPVVAVVYHFFAHYRRPVMQKLLADERYRFVLAGDTRDPSGTGIVPWKPEDPERFIEARCRVFRGNLMVQKGLVQLAMRRDIKAVIFLGDVHYVSTWIAAAVARAFGKRVLFWTIGWLRPESGPKDWLRRAFYHLSHGLLLYGHYAKQMAVSKGFPVDRLWVVYNSLDYEEQRRVREGLSPETVAETRHQLFPDPETPLLICVSRLTRHRRLDTLLHAMRHLKDQGHPCNLLLVGEGAERTSLMELAAGLGVSVMFYGECYDEAVLGKLLVAADITVAPGMVGLTAMQSLAYGTPVITHGDPDKQAPEWEAVRPGENGDIFRFGDSEDLARVILKWSLNGVKDQRLCQNCQAVIERYYNPDYQVRVITGALSGVPPE